MENDPIAALPGVAEVRLDRPAKGNALSPELVAHLQAAVDAAGADAAVHTLLFHGEGKHFCTGFDLSTLGEETDASLCERFVRLERLLQSVWHSPKRTVALATGRAWGAGADLFAACDVRGAIAGTSLRFPGAGFGIVLGTRRLVELVGWDRARPLVTEGAMVDTDAALAAGLVGERIDGDPQAWAAARCAPPPVDLETLAAIRHATRADHRAADLETLRASATRPGLKRRIEAYRERQLAARARPA